VPAFHALLAGLELEPLQAAYMGDDVLDLGVLEQCGFAITVPDAPTSVKRCAHYVTRRRGGEGAVREACELLLSLRATKSRRAGA
jgi:3-deoxy-D-manno-octulosonate 8-phosphate phosphatase (KDO 8-P phosphatase)